MPLSVVYTWAHCPDLGSHQFIFRQIYRPSMCGFQLWDGLPMAPLIDPTMSVNQDISFRAMFSNLTRLHHTLWLTSDENCPDSSFNLCRRMKNQGNSNQHICMVKNVMSSSRLFIENQTTSLSSQKWLEGNFAENLHVRQ